ncbi:MAG: hypothetical protein ABI824_04080 [Acidobacteriota bacterium]
MTIELKPEQEKIIEYAILRGHFKGPEEVLDAALAALETARIEELRSKSLSQFLMESPFYEAELNLERQPDVGRDLRDVIL